MAPKAKLAARRAKAKAKAKTGGKARNAARIEYFRGTVGLVPWAGKAVYVGGGVVQVVTVPWGWYFGVTVGLVPWVEKAVPWEVVLCK